MLLHYSFVALPSPPFNPPGSSTFFYLQNGKNEHFLFCFRCPICLPPDWESATRGKIFWCPWKTSGRDIRVSFRLPTQGLFFVHFKVPIGRIHINSSFSPHAMSLPRVYNAFLRVAQRECPNS